MYKNFIYIYKYKLYIFIYIYIYIHIYCKVTCPEEAAEMAAKYLHDKKMYF